jgi:predicted SnoaL-like aldol condensation-catalyzing enzyme
MTMTLPGHAAVQQQDPVQRLIYEAADQLRDIYGLDSTDKVIEAVEDLKRFEANKEVLLRFQREVFNAGDWSTETLQRNLTDDFIDHAAMQGDPPGLEGVQARFSAWAAAFEGALAENKMILGRGDLLAAMYTLHAHHRRQFMGIPPTNRDVAIPGMEVIRIRDGKIAEHWGIYDFLRTAEEIGANLAFMPRNSGEASPQLDMPWEVKTSEDDTDGLGVAAYYLRRHGEQG